MILLPGCLPGDSATLRALCEGLPAHAQAASRLGATTVEPCHGSWTDAEREATGCKHDLPVGLELARQAQAHAQMTASTGAGPTQTVAVATPVHAALALTDLTATEPEQLALSEDDSRALCVAANAHLRDEGVQLDFVGPLQWLVTCDQPVDVLTERPDWMIGEALRPNLPRGANARMVERWMNELQMLLYTHPVNAAREDRGLPPVNVVWLWGFSPSGESEDDGVALLPPDTRWLRAIRNGDPTSWQQAWADVIPQLLSADSIIIGDHRPRLRLTPSAPTALSRIKSVFGRTPALAQVLQSLQASL